MKPNAKHINRNKRFRKSKVRSVAKDHKSFDYLLKTKTKLN